MIAQDSDTMLNTLLPGHSGRFNFLSKLLRRANREAIEAFVHGTLKAPLLVELDPTSACNFSCPECISSELLNQGGFSSDRLMQLIEELALSGVQAVIFIGGGEPLAHPAMPKPIQRASERGLGVGLTTNGSLIKRHLDTIAEHCDWTRVSVDAAFERTFNLFRPSRMPDAFRRVIDGISSLANRKTGALGFSFLICQRTTADGLVTNAGELYSAAKLAKDIGCDYFEFKPMVDSAHYLIPLGPSLTQTLQEEIEKCGSLVDESFDIIQPPSMRHLFENPDPAQPKAYETCPAMELRTLITPTGVYPCPYHRGCAEKSLGTILQTPFDEFWAGQSRGERMRETVPSRDCSFYCIRHSTNIALHALNFLTENGVSILDCIDYKEIDDPFF